MSETVFKSMHGRELGMNSSGQLVGQRDKTDTTLYPISSIKKVQAAVATGSTAENAGMQILSSGTATAQSYEIKAPVPGVDVQLHVGQGAEADRRDHHSICGHRLNSGADDRLTLRKAWHQSRKAGSP